MAFSGTGGSNKFRQSQTSQAELYRENLKAYGKGTDAYYDATEAIKVQRVSAATEFEDFRRLPKYTHIPLAVIHPSPIKRMMKPRRPDCDFEVQASPSRMN